MQRMHLRCVYSISIWLIDKRIESLSSLSWPCLRNMRCQCNSLRGSRPRDWKTSRPPLPIVQFRHRFARRGPEQIRCSSKLFGETSWLRIQKLSGATIPGIRGSDALAYRRRAITATPHASIIGSAAATGAPVRRVSARQRATGNSRCAGTARPLSAGGGGGFIDPNWQSMVTAVAL